MRFWTLASFVILRTYWSGSLYGRTLSLISSRNGSLCCMLGKNSRRRFVYSRVHMNIRCSIRRKTLRSSISFLETDRKQRFRYYNGISSNYSNLEYRDSLAQWLEHAIADRRVACSNHAGVLLAWRSLFFRSLALAISLSTIQPAVLLNFGLTIYRFHLT